MRSILTNREKTIFTLLVQGFTTNKISSSLKISEKTVRNHISNVIQKLECNNRTDALISLIKLGELSL